MPERIPEKDLVLPALYCIDTASNPPISTSALQERLRDLLRPEGEDLEILAGRGDDKFSQKVRNLRSHKTLEKLDLVTYTSSGGQGYWTITPTGKAYLRFNRSILAAILESKFDYEAKKKTLRGLRKPEKGQKSPPVMLDENSVIYEGTPELTSGWSYKRSKALRDAAIRKFTINGRIKCSVCKFDFAEKYGELGKGFIEIHHINALYSYEDEDVTVALKEALDNVVPLCSNCHRMIHRSNVKILTIEELLKILSK